MTTALPLPKTIQKSQLLPKRLEYPVNYVFNEGSLIPRPGVETVEAVNGDPRGMFVYGGILYVLFGTKLYKFASGSLSLVGTIDGVNPIKVAKGFNHAAICSPQFSNYTLSTSGTLTKITDTDLPACDDVARVDGYFIWIPSDGDPAIFSAVGDASDIDPVDYFDAEVLPDENRGVINFKNDLFIMGQESIERFRNIGTASAPFLRVNGGMIQVGYVSAKVMSKDTFLFLGKDMEKGHGFFMQANGTAERVSSPSIDEILEQEYAAHELADCVSQRFTWRGMDVYVFTLARHTLAFAGGNWSFFASGVSVRDPATWDYQFATFHNGRYYIAKEGSFARFTEEGDDEGTDVAHGFVAFARSETEQVFNVSYLRLMATQGLSSGSNTVGLSVSKNGKLWSDHFYRDLGGLGEYSQQLEWRYPGGLGQYDGFIGIEVKTTAPLGLATEGGVIGL